MRWNMDGDRRSGRVYQSTAPAIDADYLDVRRHDKRPDVPLQPGADYRRYGAHHVQGVGSHVAVPFLQAIATAVVLWLASFLVAWQWLEWPWRDALSDATVFTALVLAGAWILLLADTRKLLWTVERLTFQDLNNDGTVGKPADDYVIEISDGNRIRYIHASDFDAAGRLKLTEDLDNEDWKDRPVLTELRESA